MKNSNQYAIFRAGFILITLSSFVFISFGCGSKHSVSVSSSEEKSVYQCSMHPQIVSDKPGNCPICHMPLTKVDSASVKKTAERKVVFYRHPMRPDVSSPVPAKDEMGMDFIPVYQEDAVSTSSIQIPGHAEVIINPVQQQLIGLKTSEVKKIPFLVKVRTLGRVGYDPDLYETIFEYRDAIFAHKKFRGNRSTAVLEKTEQLHELAMMKLRLAGLSDDQMSIIARYIATPQYFVLPPDLHWVYADIYEQEAELVRPGQMAMITAPTYPGQIFKGEVKSIDPLPNASSRVLRARIQVEPSGKILGPGMTLDVEIEAVLGEKLGVPVDAVFDTGEMKLVFVDKGEGHLEPREVMLGHENETFFEVISGVSEGEKVIDSATFLIDSESRLRAASQRFVEAMKEKPHLEPSKSAEPDAAESAHQHAAV